MINSFPLYSLFVLLALIGGYLQWLYLFKKKHMPDLLSLTIKFFFVVPWTIFGARLWTYFFSDNLWEKINDQPNFWEKLKYFFGLTEEGIQGLSIHGGVIFALIGFLILFYFYAKKHHISLLFCCDVLVKCFLVAQIIGRWGNFFNQELLGEIITSKYPLEYSWIDQNFGQFLKFNQEPENILRHPLFLYEILGNALVWLLITFLIPLFPKIINHWFSKQTNHENFINTNIPKIRISDGKIWRWQILPFQKGKIYDHQKKMISTKKWYQRYFYLFLLFLQRDSKKLSFAFDDHPIPYLRVGVIFGCYFFFYGIVRLILQPLRNVEDNLNDVMEVTNITSIIFIIFGILIIWLSIFVIPKKWRSYDWFYEKWYLIK